MKNQSSIPSVYQAPGAWGIALGLCSLAIFFAFVAFDEASRGKVATFSFVAISASAGLCWQYRDRIWFWAIEIVAACAHGLLVFAVQWPNERSPAYEYWPIIILDTLALVLLLNGIGWWAKAR
jgi:hypothetical protein